MFARRFFIFLLTVFFVQTSFSQIDSQEKYTALSENVKQEFLHSWNSYKQYAWGHDDLKPLSKSYHDWYAESLLMTPVDALDVMYIMDLKEEAEKTKNYITANLSFDKNISVKNFEITIRLLGGLLSSYQLSGDAKLLALADELGQRLLPAFNSPTGMPYMFVNLKTGEVNGKISNPAEIGTLMIEFGTLSKLTRKQVYFDKAKKALVQLFNNRSSIGLVGSAVNVETGEWVNTTSHISGGIDSYYEYLLKCALLFDDNELMDMWKKSIEPINKYLADSVETGFWYGQSEMNTGERNGTSYGALDAFMPAVLALGGDLERAKKLQESSYKMWLLNNIEPEQIDYTTLKVTYPSYPLRPEIIESAYYLFHFTGDLKYRKMGETFFNDIKKYCRGDVGYTALKNVETKEKSDEMESFFLAETLKYFYLLFSKPETLDFNKTIFNTEAHPMRKTW